MAVHRNASSTGLVVASGHETALSSTDTYGFGYGRTVALLVRYDTRVRIHASYGCTVRIGYEEATRTGGGFFHGGVALNAEPNCGPGDYIDIIPEDWRMLSSGKKRLVFDHTCGIIPLCADPVHPPPSTDPPPPPNPPPFPPGTTGLPPGTPTTASPPSPSLPPGVLPPTVELGSTSTALLTLGMAGLCGFGCLQLYFMAWFKRSATAARNRFAEGATAIPVAKIAEDGKTSIVTGVAVVRNAIGKGRFGDERESLLSGPRY